MAVLPDSDRFDVWAGLMRDISGRQEGIAISKADLRAAVDAIDTFFHNNAATINNALPAAARAGLTTPQKALLLMYVIQRRYLSGV